MTAGPGVKPTRNTGRLDNWITDAVGSELPFAAICTSGRSADFSDLRYKCANVRFGEPFNKRSRLCENSEFGSFWCRWFLDVDLSDLQLNGRGHKFGLFGVFRAPNSFHTVWVVIGRRAFTS
jgi:hypothetical protein